MFTLTHDVCLCLCVQVNNSTNGTEDAEVEDTVAFPNELYSQAFNASVSHPQLWSTAKMQNIKIYKCRLLYLLYLSVLLLLFLLLFFFQAEDKLAFTAQILNEMSALFEEDHSSASWEENTVENFVNVITQQADGFRSCVSLSGV